jgi:nucleoid-associated protein Lsr2
MLFTQSDRTLSGRRRQAIRDHRERQSPAVFRPPDEQREHAASVVGLAPVLAGYHPITSALPADWQVDHLRDRQGDLTGTCGSSQVTGVGMARRTIVALEDDLDGGPADETVRFGVGGSEYEIDLSEKNAAKLRKQLAPFVEHARRAGSQPRRPVRTAASRRRSRDIRDWARDQGIQLSERGRIPAGIAAQYEAETGRSARRLAAGGQVWIRLGLCPRWAGQERIVSITPPLRHQPAGQRRRQMPLSPAGLRACAAMACPRPAVRRTRLTACSAARSAGVRVRMHPGGSRLASRYGCRPAGPSLPVKVP